MLERWLAKLGTVGVLAILLTASVALNAWQFNRAGKADARCASRIAGMVADVDRVTAAREVKAIEIARETKEDAEEAVNEIESETVRYVERIRTIEVPVVSGCPTELPSGVQDTISDATRAANSFVPAR
jgi:hypothetical protein